MEFGQLHHIEYYVRDLNRSNDFWDWFLAGFGYEEYQRWSEGVSWRHACGTYIVFVQLSGESMKIQNDRKGNGLNHIALLGRDTNHLEGLHAELFKRGIKILKFREDYLCFEDPNDFAVEIFLPESK